MKKFNKVTIIGVGLIGGSIGLAIKKAGLAKEVVGVFRRKSTLYKALRRKAVDKGTLDVADGVIGADLIILATPVRTIPLMAKKAVKFAKNGAIITDVGSTKVWIVAELERIVKSRKGVSFVGSHPMAGSDHASVEFARRDLLAGAPCIVTKTRATDPKSLETVIGLWKALGARVGVMSPARHDMSVSLVSHLPHIVAFSVAGAVPERELAYAAEGFKDTTRVASSDPELWADIFITNRREIAKACRRFERYYREITDALGRNDYGSLVRALKKAKVRRDKFVYGKSA